MTTQPYDDPDYPYSARPSAVLAPTHHVAEPAPRFPWRELFKIALRLALAAAVLFILCSLPIVVVALRATSQAAIIADLESRGCSIGYENEYIYEPETLQEFLQEVFGNEYFGDVDSVSALTLNKPEHAAAICRLCAKFSKLTDFSIKSDAFQFDHIAHWSHLDQLISLGIHSNQLTDDDLVRIGQMENLAQLRITSNRITDAGLQSLNGLPQLSSLDIGSVSLPGKDSSNNAGFPNLTRLGFQNVPELRDQAIVNLGPLPELTQVVFDDSGVGDQALDHVTRGGKLEYVHLKSTKVTDAGLSYLARCPTLSMLELSGTAITDNGIHNLAVCGELTHLDVSDTKISGHGWKVLHGKDLSLIMDRTQLDDEGLRDVLSIVGLTSLTATNTKITGTGAGQLRELETVNSLELIGNPLTFSGIQVLAQAKTPRLVLTNTPLDDKTLMLFTANDHIIDLVVSETKVTAAGVIAFYEARKRRLEAAGQKETLTLSCDFPDAIESYLPKDEFLSIDGTPLDITPTEPEPPPPAEPQSPAPPSSEPPQP